MADNIEMQGLEFEIVANTEKAEKGLNKLINTLERLKKALSGVDASDTTAAIKDIDKALNGVDDSKMSKLKNTLSKVGSAAQSVKDKISGLGTIPISDGGIGAESVSELTEVSGRVGILTRAFDRLKSSLPELKGAVGKVGNALNNFGKGIVSKVTGLAKQFKRAVFYSLLYNAAYTLINSITKAFQEGFTNMYSYSQAFAGKFSQSMDSLATSTLYLKNSLASAFAPLVNQLAPVIDALIQKVATLLNYIAQLMSALSGQSTYTKAVKATTKFAESTGKAAKSLKSFIAGFDELNVFEKGSGSGSGAGTPDFASMFEEAQVDSKIAATAQKLNEIKNMIADNLAEITIVASGFSLAVGAVLAFSGTNIPLGLTLMGAGAIGLISAAKLDWAAVNGKLKSVMASINGIVSGTFLALGAVLAFSGKNVPLGIALMALGATTLATAAALNWNGLSDEVKNVIAVITAALSVAFLAVGAALAFTGTNIPLGLALMGAGAVTMGTAIVPNWKALSDNIRKIITTVTSVLGGALLVVGAILAFSTAALPLGLGLMAAGALSLGSAVALNWNTVVTAIKKVVSAIAGILGGALTVLGVLLCLSGAGIGLGLAVLAAGLGLSYAAWSLDDNPITNFVRRMANSIIGIINRVVDAINNVFHISFRGLSVLGKEVVPAFNARLVNIPHVPTFADGGFVDEGQLFIARESGAEMVGNIGRKTAVANNDQIVESVSQGVYEAVQRANGETNSGNSRPITVIVQMNGKELFRQMVDENNAAIRATGFSPLLV